MPEQQCSPSIKGINVSVGPRRRRPGRRSRSPTEIHQNPNSSGKMKQHRISSPNLLEASQEHITCLDENTSQPASTFSSTSSLKQEIALASDCANSTALPTPTESLASHGSGSTFASKARAAELQAARARQVLNTRSTGVLGEVERAHVDGFDNMPRRGFMWKRMEFSEKDTSEEPAWNSGKENVPEQIQITEGLADSKSISASFPDSYGKDDNLEEAEQPQQLGVDELTILAPTATHVRQHRLSEFVSGSTTLSFDIFSPEEDDPSNFEPVAYDFASLDPNYSTSLSSFYPMALPSYSYDIGYETEDERDLSGVASRPPSTIGYSRPSYSRMERSVGNADGFRNTAVEALRSTYPFNHRRGNGNNGFYDTGPAQLKARPPHYYPAVKGTRSDLDRSSTAGASADHEPLIALDKLPAFHVQTSADANEAIAAAEWNVRRQDGSLSQKLCSSTRVSPLTEDEDDESWTKRRVQIFDTAGYTAHSDAPIIFGQRMTADGVFPVHEQNIPSDYIPPTNIPRTNVRRNPSRRWYDLLTDKYRTDGCMEDAEEELYQEPIKVYSHLFARSNPPSGNGPTSGRFTTLQNTVQLELEKIERLRIREAAERDALRAANFSDDPPKETSPVRAMDGNDDAWRCLLLTALANLATYRRGTRHHVNDYFYRMGEAPTWCVDHGPDGNDSFFGGDWGTPPARVGRDPRYRLNGQHGPVDWSGVGQRLARRWVR